MGVEIIKAGEAYVLVSCDNTGFKKGLQEVTASVDSTARRVKEQARNLSPTMTINANPIKKAFSEIHSVAQESLNKSRSVFDHFSVSLGDVVTTISGALRSIVSSLGEMGDKFDKASKRIGASSAFLSELAHASTMTGADFSAAESAFKGMALTLDKARQGSAEAVAALSLVGVSLNEIKDATPEELFERLAQGVASIADPTTRAAAAMKVFGENGRALLPSSTKAPKVSNNTGKKPAR